MATALSIGAFPRELYYATYVLFFRISRWEGTTRTGSSVALISIVKSLVVFGAICWLQVMANQRFHFDSWVGVPVYLVLYMTDFWFLIVRGAGDRFEREFDSLPRDKRIYLRLSAMGIVVSSVVFFLLSVRVHHEVFGIPF